MQYVVIRYVSFVVMRGCTPNSDVGLYGLSVCTMLYQVKENDRCVSWVISLSIDNIKIWVFHTTSNYTRNLSDSREVIHYAERPHTTCSFQVVHACKYAQGHQFWTQLNKRVRCLISRWCNSFPLTFYKKCVLYLPVLYRRLSQRTNHPQIYQWWEMSRAKWPCLKSFDKLLTYCLCLYLYAHIAIVVRRNWNFIVSNMLCKYIMNPHYTGIALYSVLFLDMLSIFAQFSMNIMLHDYCCAI